MMKYLPMTIRIALVAVENVLWSFEIALDGQTKATRERGLFKGQFPNEAETKEFWTAAKPKTVANLNYVMGLTRTPPNLQDHDIESGVERTVEEVMGGVEDLMDRAHWSRWHQ